MFGGCCLRWRLGAWFRLVPWRGLVTAEVVGGGLPLCAFEVIGFLVVFNSRWGMCKRIQLGLGVKERPFSISGLDNGTIICVGSRSREDWNLGWWVHAGTCPYIIHGRHSRLPQRT